MKKLQELTKEELKALYNENRGFQSKIWEGCYEGNMLMQSEEYKEIFGENNKTIAYHDHYTSFYLTITDHDHFVESIENPDMLTVEGRDLYNKAKELAEKWNNMDYDAQDENSGPYGDLEETQNKLLQEIEDQLHGYESIEDSQIEEELGLIAEGVSGMSDWETDGKKVFITTVKILH